MISMAQKDFDESGCDQTRLTPACNIELNSIKRWTARLEEANGEYNELMVSDE